MKAKPIKPRYDEACGAGDRAGWRDTHGSARPSRAGTASLETSAHPARPQRPCPVPLRPPDGTRCVCRRHPRALGLGSLYSKSRPSVLITRTTKRRSLKSIQKVPGGSECCQGPYSARVARHNEQRTSTTRSNRPARQRSAHDAMHQPRQRPDRSGRQRPCGTRGNPGGEVTTCAPAPPLLPSTQSREPEARQSPGGRCR